MTYDTRRFFTLPNGQQGFDTSDNKTDWRDDERIDRDNAEWGAMPEPDSRPPYPEFCRHPDLCAGKGCCPRDPCCCD